MIALKPLGKGQLELFSDGRWPAPTIGTPGSWVPEASTNTEPKVFACTLPTLAEWLDDELWLVELGSDAHSEEDLLVASQGRLVRRIHLWTSDAAMRFVLACIDSARRTVADIVPALDSALDTSTGSPQTDLAGLQSRANALAQESRGLPAHAAAYLADVVELAAGGRPASYRQAVPQAAVPTPGALAANLGFVVAHVAGDVRAKVAAESAAGSPGAIPAAYDLGYQSERRRQELWLRELLSPDLPGTLLT